MAKTAYANPNQPARTARDSEYDIFARTTYRLKQASARADTDYSGLAQAVYDNRRLWRMLAADLALPGNGLPEMLRARLLYLNDFTQTHSRKVLSGVASAEVLIEINTAIMRGLRNEGGGA